MCWGFVMRWGFCHALGVWLLFIRDELQIGLDTFHGKWFMNVEEAWNFWTLLVKKWPQALLYLRLDANEAHIHVPIKYQ